MVFDKGTARVLVLPAGETTPKQTAEDLESAQSDASALGETTPEPPIPDGYTTWSLKEREAYWRAQETPEPPKPRRMQSPDRARPGMFLAEHDWSPDCRAEGCVPVGWSLDDETRSDLVCCGMEPDEMRALAIDLLRAAATEGADGG
jgi:hypothetical protein